jgi:RNA polymerase sigma-70 factor (ECF subfamily)
MDRRPVHDDAQLVEAAMAGNRAAFGQLVSRYQNRLFSSLVYVTGSAEAAEDIAQDAVLQAFRKLNTFQRASGFYTWLYRIAFNLAVSQRRRERVHASLDEAREARGHEPADPAPGPGSRLDSEERVASVQAGLAALSEEHRAILLLREVEECSYEQIAEILDLPVGTIRSRLHRARLQLRDQLKRMLQDEAV